LEVMKIAVERDPAFFSCASARLQALPELILASITPKSAWNTIKTVPQSLQRQHPEITIKAIALCEARNLRYLPTNIPDEMWQNHRDVCIAWIRRGGRVLDSFERTLKSDPQMALEVAKHNWCDFYKVGERLLNDRDFMMQALDLDGRVLRFASATLRQDFDVVVVAVANHYKNCGGEDGGSTSSSSSSSTSSAASSRLIPSVEQSFASLVNLDPIKREVRRLLDLHETFVKEFLRGIAISSPHLAPALRSQLSMLDRGVETSEAFKRLIAEYLGVPVGPKLTLLRKAQANLQRPSSGSASWMDNSDLFVTGGPNDAFLMGGPRRGADREELLRYRRFARRARLHPRGNNDDVMDDVMDDDNRGVGRVGRVLPGPRFLLARAHRPAPPNNNDNNNVHVFRVPAAARRMDPNLNDDEDALMMDAGFHFNMRGRAMDDDRDRLVLGRPGPPPNAGVGAGAGPAVAARAAPGNGRNNAARFRELRALYEHTVQQMNPNNNVAPVRPPFAVDGPHERGLPGQQPFVNVQNAAAAAGGNDNIPRDRDAARRNDRIGQGNVDGTRNARRTFPRVLRPDVPDLRRFDEDDSDVDDLDVLGMDIMDL